MVKNKEMHSFLWLWLPLSVAVIQIFLELLLPAQTLSVLHSESGPHELLQFLIIFVALTVSATMLLKINFKKTPWLGAWVGIATLSCLYVAGEEISWGQHVMDWATPGYWSNVNDQGETNLHNISSWLDQKPRLILEIGVIVGGLIIPFLMKVRPDALPERFAIIYPAGTLCVTAGLFLALKLADKAEALGIYLFERGSEVQELYLFYFVLLYCLELRKRLASRDSAFEG